MQDEEAASNVCNTWPTSNAAFLVIWGATLVTERHIFLMDKTNVKSILIKFNNL